MAGRVGRKGAIKSAVKPARRSLRKSQFATSQAELEAAFNSITQLVMILDSDYTIKWANKATATFLKLPMSKITGKYCYTLMHGTDKPLKSCPLAKMMISKKHEEAGLYIAEKKIWAQVRADPQFDKKGNIVSIIHTVNDITRQKQAEEDLRHSETFLKSIIEQSPHAMWISDSSGTLIKLNQACRDLLNITDEEVVGKYNVLEDNIVKEQGFMPLVRDVFQKGATAEFTLIYDSSQLKTLQLQRKSHVILEVTISPVIGANGKITNAIIQHIDITERKQAEEALQKSEAQYRLLGDHMTDTVWLMDMNLQTTYQSPSVQRLRGFTLREIEEMPLEKHLTPQSLKIATDAFLEEMAKIEADPGYNFSRTLELEFYRKDGTTFWSENTFSLIRDENSKPQSILGEGRDITERLQTEEVLRQSEAKYRTVLEQMEEAYYEVDLAGNLTFFNDATCRQLGYSAEELTGMNYRVYTSKDDIRREYEIFNQVYRTGKPNTGFPICRIRKDGALIFTENSALPLRNKDGKIIGFRGVARDITKRLQAEDALRKSEALYRLLAEHMTDTIRLIDMNLKTTYVSPSAEKQRGFTHQEMLEMPLDKQLTPESFRVAVGILSEELPRVEADPGYNPVHTLDLEYYCKDGTTVWAESQFSVIRDENGKPVSILAEARDITARKQAQTALQKANEMLALAQEAAGSGAWDWDMTTGQLNWSPELFNIFGLDPSKQSASFDTWRAILHPQDRQHAEEKINEAISNHVKLFNEYRIIPPGGEVRWISAWGDTQYNYHGEGKRMMGICIDVTERKRAEAALLESEAQYRLLSEHTTDTVWLVDMSLKTTYTSPSSEKLLGFTHQELMEMPAEKYLTPDSFRLAIDTFWKEIPRVEADPDYNPVFTLELEYFRKDGTTLWTENKLSLIRDENGKPVSVLGETRDITERKEAERIIKKQGEEYRTIFNSVRPGIAYFGKDGSIQRINKSGAAFFGLEPEEIVGKTDYDLVPAPEADVFTAENNEVISSGIPKIGLIHEFSRPSGKKRWIQVDRLPYLDEHGDIIGVIMLTQDITRRMLSEEKLVKSVESLKKTLDDAINTMVKIVEIRDPYTAGHQQKVADLSTAIAREMNLEEIRIDQLRMAAITHDIGKMYVPSDILSKPGKLSNIEFGLIKTHSQSGYNIVKGMDFPCAVADAVLQHHERLDGSGYPAGLKGEDMILEAKILAVADVVEAMASHCPYRSALGIDKALEEISKNRGRLFDPEVVDACLELFRNGRFEFKSV